MKKNLLSILLVVVLAFGFLTGCKNDDPDTPNPGDNNGGGTSGSVDYVLNNDLTFSLVYLTGTGTYASEFINGFRSQCEELGITPIVSDATGSQDRMIAYLDAAINQKVDAILISHGDADALKASVQRALDAGITVITKDVDLNMEDVSVVDQDDYLLALQSVKQMCQDIDGKGNVVRGYANGFVPQERRYSIYQLLINRFEDVNEVATFGSVTANSSLDAQTKMAAILTQYPEANSISAVWCGWEEWAKGASRAIMEANRTDEVKVYSVDISDETLQMLQDPENPFTAASGVSPSMAAKVAVRMALKRVAGEDIPRYYFLSPQIVQKSDILSSDVQVTMANLGTILPGWGENNEFWTDWMRTMVD